LHIGYNGYNYRGWQRQYKVSSIQEVLETNLTKLLKTPIVCLGCGRTDAQVHASQYFFHMDVDKVWSFDLLFRLNKMLSEDIAIFDIIPMEGYPHAQLDATRRTYDYFIHTYKDPFLFGLSSFYPLKNPDLIKMKAASSLMLKYNDFGAFCKSPDKNPSNICNVSSVQLFSDKNGDKIRFQISSNRFLKGMVRIIIKKIMDIGIGELSLDEFESYLALKSTPPNTIPAYPQGLYLSKVEYPFLDVPPRIEFSTIFQNKVDNAWIAL
jgi:tRNA pseudouridine38-40 synthase